MKTIITSLTGLSLLFLIFLSACNDTDPTPAIPVLRPDKVITDFDGGQLFRNLSYTPDGKLSSITAGSVYGDVVTEVIEDLLYSGDTLKQITINGETPWVLEYTYNDQGQLASTKSYIGGTLSETLIFSYNDDGQLTSRIAYQDVDGEGDIDPVFKATFTYSGKNLVEMGQYGHNGTDYVFISKLQYMDFDDKKNPSELFYPDLYHPFTKLFENNPRLVRVINPHGIATDQQYTFEYNSQGYAIKQRTDGTDDVINYQFKEIQ